MVRFRVQQLAETIQSAVGAAVAQPLVEAAEEMGFLDSNR